MRKAGKIIALSLGSLLSLSLFAACGKDAGGGEQVGSDVVTSARSAVVVCDNLGGGYIA